MPVDNRIREVRRRHNVSQLQLAEALQITRQTMIALEENRYHPSLELALRISTYFDTSVEELFNLEDIKQHREKKKKNLVFIITLNVILLVGLNALYNEDFGFLSGILPWVIGTLIGLGIAKLLPKKHEHPNLPERDERVAARIRKFTNYFLVIAIGIFSVNGFILDYIGDKTITMLFVFQFMLVGIFSYLIGASIVRKR